MKLLVDTHLLLWAGSFSDRLTPEARRVLDDDGNNPIFSVASIWEIAIKFGRGRKDFVIDPALFRRDLLRNGYQELSILSEHAIAGSRLAPIHKDPFDRMLIAQATVEGITLLTADAMLARYPGPIMLV
jgi:PIN domain nuclease of toxin-antitoxin system